MGASFAIEARFPNNAHSLSGPHDANVAAASAILHRPRVFTAGSYALLSAQTCFPVTHTSTPASGVGTMSGGVYGFAQIMGGAPNVFISFMPAATAETF